MDEIGNLSYKKRGTRFDIKHNASITAFIATTICYYFLLILSLIAPLGKNCLLFSDLAAQYAPLILLLKRHLTNLDVTHFLSSLTYSNSLGLGKNMMGTFGYYLLSPFNLFIFLFKSTSIAIFIALLIGTKLAFASAFMAMFMKSRKFGSKISFIFGILYAFTAYAIVFAFNIMWLDGYLLLPLLLFFVEKFINSGKYKGLVFTLLLLFITNYYVAYMVGVCSFFYLIVRLIERKDEFKGNEILGKIMKFIAISFAVVLACSVILLPVILDTVRNIDVLSVQREQPKYFSFTFLKIIDQLFLGSSGDFLVLNNNLPFIFSSLSVTTLIILYFSSKDIFDKRIKKIRAVVFVAMFVIFFVDALDIFMQGMQHPHWFLHRFSFIFYPIMFVVAAETFSKIKQIPNKIIMRVVGIEIALLLISQSFYKMKESDMILAYNLFFIVLYGVIFIIYKKTEWNENFANMPRIIPKLLVIILLFEVVGINTRQIHQSTYVVGGKEQDKFAATMNDITDLVDSTQSANNGKRIEYNVCETNKKEEVLTSANSYIGYNGISIFNSASIKPLGRFMKQLGYDVNYNYYSVQYNYSLPMTDNFFSIGNVIMGRNDYKLADNIKESSSGDYFMMNNKNVLPVAFEVDKEATDFDFYSLETDTEEKDYFKFLDSWYQSLFPHEFEKDCFKEIDSSDIGEPKYINASSIKGNNYDFADKNAKVQHVDSIADEEIKDYQDKLTYVYKQNNKIPMALEYEFKAPQSGELYMNISTAKYLKDCKIYVNDENIQSYTSSFSTITELGNFDSEDNVKVAIVVSDENIDSFDFLDVKFAFFDKNAYLDQMEKVTNSIVTDEFNDGYLSLTVNSKELNSDKTILTTIPYEKGWKCYVDGKETKVIKSYQDAFILVDLPEEILQDNESHKVELKFVAPGFKSGIVMSLIGIILLVLIYFSDKKKTNQINNVETEKKAN